MKNHNRKCLNCKKKFYSSKGKENCSACNRLLGVTKPNPQNDKIRILRALKRNCEDVRVYATDIKLLATKMKWNLINPIDNFRIADLYMKITCNDLKYSTKDAYQQAEFMIAELLKLLTADILPKTPGNARVIVQLNKEGEVIREFKSVRTCAKELDYAYETIQRRCDGLKSSVREILKWKKDI